MMASRSPVIAALVAATCAAPLLACEGANTCDQPPPIAADRFPQVVRVRFPFAADPGASPYLQTRGHAGYACDPETAEDERACPLDLIGVRWDEAEGALTRWREDGGASADEPFAEDVLWERPVYAPISGRVIACWRGMPDDDDDDDDINCPGGDRLCTPAGNFVTILGDDGVLVSLCHLRAESVPLSVCPIDETYLYADGPKRCTLGAPWAGLRDASRLDRRGLAEPTIAAGEYLGQIGASGSGKGVHLHIHAKPYAHDGEHHCEGPSLPLSFDHARFGRACEGSDPAAIAWQPLAGDVLPIDGTPLLFTAGP